MENSKLIENAAKIFDALCREQLVMVAGKTIDLVGVKNGRLMVYSFGDAKFQAFDATNYEVAVYEKKVVLHEPEPTAPAVTAK